MIFLGIVLLLFLGEGGRTSEILADHVPPFFNSLQVLFSDVAVLVIKVGILLDIFEDVVILNFFIDSSFSPFSISFSLICF